MRLTSLDMAPGDRSIPRGHVRYPVSCRPAAVPPPTPPRHGRHDASLFVLVAEHPIDAARASARGPSGMDDEQPARAPSAPCSFESIANKDA